MLFHYLRLIYLRYKNRFLAWWKKNKDRIYACFNEFNDVLFKVINAFIDLFGLVLYGFWFVFGGFFGGIANGIYRAANKIVEFLKEIFVAKPPPPEDPNKKKPEIAEKKESESPKVKDRSNMEHQRRGWNFPSFGFRWSWDSKNNQIKPNPDNKLAAVDEEDIGSKQGTNSADDFLARFNKRDYIQDNHSKIAAN